MGPGTGARQAPWAVGRPRHHRGAEQYRRGWLKADPPAHAGGRQPAVIAVRPPPTIPSAVAPWEKGTEPPDRGGATSRGCPAAQSGAHSSLCHPPRSERGAPGGPGPVTANAPRPARAPESSSPALSPYRELFLLLGSTPLKVVVVVMAPRGEVGWRRENAEGDWDQPAQTAPQSPPAALHEPLPLWGSPDPRFIGLPGPTLRGSPLASLKGSLRFYWFPSVLITVRHQDGLPGHGSA